MRNSPARQDGAGPPAGRSFFSELFVVGGAEEVAAGINRFATRQVHPAMRTFHHVLDRVFARGCGGFAERALVGADHRPYCETNNNQQQNSHHAIPHETKLSIAWRHTVPWRGRRWHRMSGLPPSSASLGFFPPPRLSFFGGGGGA